MSESLKNTMTWAARITVGLLFIFSGLIKANDPYGFGHKLEDYFSIFHVHFFQPASVGISIMICILEVFMGFWLIIGFKPVLNVWSLLLLILFFDVLTGYTALANYAKDHPTSWISSSMVYLTGSEKPELINTLHDCGCFGDFIKLKPYQSFWKDVILSLLITWLFIRRRHISPMFNPSISAVFSFSVGFIAVAFPLFCFFFLPVFDFLPFKEGNNIVDMMKLPEGAKKDSVNLHWVYKHSRTGEVRHLLNDEYKQLAADSNWKFVDRKDELVQEGDHAPIENLQVLDQNNNLYTDLITEIEGGKLIVVARDLTNINESKLKKMASLVRELKQKTKVFVFGVTATSLKEAQKIADQSGMGITFYNIDNTLLKTMMRSNPGIMLLHKSTVIKKWSGFSIPSFETVDRYARNAAKDKTPLSMTR